MRGTTLGPFLLRVNREKINTLTSFRFFCKLGCFIRRLEMLMRLVVRACLFEDVCVCVCAGEREKLNHDIIVH